MKESLIVLAYHYFGEATTSSGIKAEDAPFFTGTDTFEQHLRAIVEKNYTPVTIAELLDGKKIPEKGIMLTIDDAHISFYEKAYPLLRKYDIPAELFVISDYIGKPDYMTKDQLCEVSKNSVGVHSHGKSHRLLNKLIADEIKAELTESKQVIENIIGHRIKAFAVPMGGYPSGLNEQLKDCGYELTFTSYHGINVNPMNHSSLKRVMVKQPNDAFEQIIKSIPFSFNSIHLYLKNVYKYMKNL